MPTTGPTHNIMTNEIVIKLKQPTYNKNRWTAFHTKWGVASGRMSTLLWDSKEEVEKWISENLPSIGEYHPILWLLSQDLVGAEINTTANETVTITKEEYESLLQDRKWLQALESAGVDNWEGYDFAREIYNEDT